MGRTKKAKKNSSKKKKPSASVSSEAVAAESGSEAAADVVLLTNLAYDTETERGQDNNVSDVLAMLEEDSSDGNVWKIMVHVRLRPLFKGETASTWDIKNDVENMLIVKVMFRSTLSLELFAATYTLPSKTSPTLRELPTAHRGQTN